MCKYCRLMDVGVGTADEKVIEDGTITRIKDGSQVIEMYMSRDISKSHKLHSNELVLSLSVDISPSEQYCVKTKAIKIKYCPFCGEEL